VSETSSRIGSASRPRFLLLVAGLSVLLIMAAQQRRSGPPHEDLPAPAPPGARPDEGAAALAKGRGRGADTPSQIPPRGWKDILVRTYREMTDDRVLAIAAGVTFYVLLALFPAIAASVAIYGLFADPSDMGEHLEKVAAFLPGNAVQFLEEQMSRLASQRDESLGLMSMVGIGVSLWSANAGTKALFDALNVAYDEAEKRGFLRLNAISLAVTLGGLLFLFLALGVIVVLPIALRYVGFGDAADLAVKILRWPLLFAALIFALTLLYRFGPSRDQPRWRWVSLGSIVAAVGWVLTSAAFSWYAENLASFDETYGTLGAAIGFMLWLWLTVIVVLTGAELNAEMEHQTARDTTTGQPRPLGQRGATMADTVGEATGS
jgi:membrane protein